MKQSSGTPVNPAAIIQWILGIVFILFAFVGGFNIGSPFFIIAGVLLLPIKPLRNTIISKIGKKFEIKTWMFVVVSLVFLVLGFIVSPYTPKSNDESIAPAETSIPEKSTEIVTETETNTVSGTTSNESTAITTESSLIVSNQLINNFINKYNSLSETKIEIIESFKPQDKTNGYYRTEYRLNAWKDSYGTAAKIGKARIDIVNYGNSITDESSKNQLRIYVFADTMDEIIPIFRTAVKAMDNTITDEEIQDKIDDLKEYGYIPSITFGNFTGYLEKDSFMLNIEY